MSDAALTVRVRERVLGLPVDALTLDETVARVANMLRRGARCRAVVVNAHKAWLAQRDAGVRDLIESAELVVAEWAVSWAAGVLQRRGIAHVGGITLMRRLLAAAEEHGWSVYLLGAKAEVVDALVQRLHVERPALQIAGWHHGYLDAESETRVLRELTERRPDLLFVAMGSPRQEHFIRALPPEGVRFAMGVGGSFDVLAGVKKDTPRWARGSGLEWVYRSAHDPKLLRRYAVTNTWFVGAVLRERLRNGEAKAKAKAKAESQRVEQSSKWLRAAVELEGWMRARAYTGYDPFDFLCSPLIRVLALGNRWLAIAWTQMGKRSAVQLRPLLGVRPQCNAKTVALVLGAHARLARVTGQPRHRESCEQLVNWLARQRAADTPGAGWGYPFPWANRAFYAPAGTPNLVVTAFAGHALLDAAELGVPSAGELADGAVEFLRTGLNRIDAPDGTFCFSYTPRDRRTVHNANLLGASLLARLAGLTGDRGLREDAERATRFSTRAQWSSGCWHYGIQPRDRWVDSFHTSYCLLALHEIQATLKLPDVEPILARGIEYWRHTFFGGPAVGFWPKSSYPIDMHAVAHAIITLVAMRERIPDALADATRLGGWALSEMRDARGFFYYRRHRFYRNRLGYMRWTQAWMLRALVELYAAGVAIAPAAGIGSERRPA